LLFPSITDEVFPVAPLEAFAKGVPVVATDSGGTSEVVENGKTGFIVPPGDALAMAAAIKQILHDTHLYGVMSCNAIEYIRNNFLEEVVADKVENILIEVLSSKIK
jgi:glycosyltransferase involved in cell wall biosynthesis